MKVSNQEAFRLHQLANTQGTNFELDDVEELDGEEFLLTLKGIVKDSPGSEAPTTTETIDVEAIKKGPVKANLTVPVPDNSIYQRSNEKGSLLDRTVQETQMI